ncbi:MAG TPA: hypothetical protein PLO37_05200 [Candidatus Hydrogenedentes bacterium]|nr:hypothetical protein [Candidatus Hydrogenedentota bacterium]HPG66222.1 hypothetical protein [Candidatus Hydrogenedentota bacterium]
MRHFTALSAIPVMAADNLDDPAEDGVITANELLDSIGGIVIKVVNALVTYLTAKELWEEP